MPSLKINNRETSKTIITPTLILIAIWVASYFIIKWLNNSELIIAPAAVSSIAVLYISLFPVKSKIVLDACFRYRWIIAAATFATLVALKVSGSSISAYNDLLPTKSNDIITTIFGNYRPIRSDEFGVSVPTYFSQYYNNYRLYSHQMSISGTNMILDYFSPVFNVVSIGKPLQWGYMLFGNERGISWYWCCQLILLFMTAQEMFLIITKGMKRESVIGAIMITLAPEIQWWFLPHMPVLIMYAMWLFCTAYHYFTADCSRKRWMFAGLTSMGAVGFAISIFPSFQVPLTYIVLVMLIACLIRDSSDISFTRKDFVSIISAAAVTFGIIAYFVIVSREDLQLLLNTVYPGRRMRCGGGESIARLFTDITSLFIPFRDITYSNNCEVSSYIHLAPFFMFLSPWFIYFLKKRGDRSWILGIALEIILLAQVFYMIIGIPEWLANITLLRFCNRMHSIYNWTGVLITIWGLSSLAKYKDILRLWQKIAFPLIYGAVHLFLIRPEINKPLKEYLDLFLFRGNKCGFILTVLSVAALVMILLMATLQERNLLTAAIIILLFWAGATVNPVEIGAGAIYNHPISKTIQELSVKDSEARWLCVDSSFMMNNYVMANGAKVIDATNFYPDTAKWSIIDKNGIYDDQTNRYANEFAEITDGQNYMKAVVPDQLRICVNPQTIKDLQIKYIFTASDDMDVLNNYGIDTNYISGQDGYSVYRLEY